MKGIVNQFLDLVGRSNTPPFLWPSTLRDLASEFIDLQERFDQKQNVPERIVALNREIGGALAAGRFEEARRRSRSTVGQKSSISTGAGDLSKAPTSSRSLYPRQPIF